MMHLMSHTAYIVNRFRCIQQIEPNRTMYYDRSMARNDEMLPTSSVELSIFNKVPMLQSCFTTAGDENSRKVALQIRLNAITDDQWLCQMFKHQRYC